MVKMPTSSCCEDWGKRYLLRIVEADAAPTVS